MDGFLPLDRRSGSALGRGRTVFHHAQHNAAWPSPRWVSAPTRVMTGSDSPLLCLTCSRYPGDFTLLDFEAIWTTASVFRTPSITGYSSTVVFNCSPGSSPAKPLRMPHLDADKLVPLGLESFYNICYQASLHAIWLDLQFNIQIKVA